MSWSSLIFWDGVSAIRAAKRRIIGEIYKRDIKGDDPEFTRLYELAYQHNWWLALNSKFPLHPAVEHLIAKHRPHDWQQLLLEWPHVSETDPARLAYTRDEVAGRADRQTVTSVGKYLRRHWPTLADHVLRDVQALFAPATIKLETGIEAMICGIELGPQSCMRSSFGSIPFKTSDNAVLCAWLKDKSNPEPAWHKHPYSVYAPEYGWGMVTRVDADGEVMGRCVVWTDPDDADRKVFVRSYQRNKKGDESQSGSDHAIESWLQARGYEHRSSWPDGCKFAYVEHPHGGPMMPYIDGNRDRVTLWTGKSGQYLELDDDGKYVCDNTDGSVTHEEDEEDDEDMTTCEDCGERVHYDDTTGIGRYGDDGCVCSSCISNYTWVRSGGRFTNYYYVPNDEAEPVYSSHANYRRGREEYYVESGVDNDDVIALADGTLATLDDAVACTCGDYFFCDDPDVVELAEPCPSTGERYAVREDAWEDANGDWYSEDEAYITYEGEKYRKEEAWQCAGTGLWYPDDVDYEEYEGETYHPEYFQRVSRSAELGDDVIGAFWSGEADIDFDRDGVTSPVSAPRVAGGIAAEIDELFVVAA